jgi:hypothetical protein
MISKSSDVFNSRITATTYSTPYLGIPDHLCGVVVKSSSLQIQRFGFDSWRYQIF